MAGLLYAAEGLFAATDLTGIGEREGLLTLVQVHKVHATGELADLIHNEPGVILWHGHLIKVYIF